MHAHLITVVIDDQDEAIDGLALLVPTLQAAPGFVAAYWLRLEGGQGTSLSVFETEEQARATAPPVGTKGGGVTVIGVQFGEVLASA
jgi:hypothetical protein